MQLVIQWETDKREEENDEVTNEKSKMILKFKLPAGAEQEETMRGRHACSLCYLEQHSGGGDSTAEGATRLSNQTGESRLFDRRPVTDHHVTR